MAAGGVRTVDPKVALWVLRELRALRREVELERERLAEVIWRLRYA